MKNKILSVILILAITFIVYSAYKGYEIKNDIENNGRISIGKYISKDSYGKQRSNYFLFYINGKKYIEDGGRTPSGFSKNIGKFYKIKYSEKFPGSIQAIFDEEVTDTAAILNAGFNEEDLK